MSDFHTLQVSRIDRLTDQAVKVTLSIPDELSDSFSFLPGQYITLDVDVAGEKVRRSYSLCSAPSTQGAISVGVKEIPNGKVSPVLNRQIKVGDSIECMPPMGNFTWTQAAQGSAHVVLIGGGSGITPLLSIATTILESNDSSKISLVYGNKNGDSIMFLEDIQAFEQQYPSRFEVVHVFDQPRKKKGLFSSKTMETIPHKEGLISKSLLLGVLNSMNVPSDSAHFYICGPSPMMRSCQQALKNIEVADERIHVEFFTEKSDEDKQAALLGDSDEGFEGKAMVQIQLDGNCQSIEVEERDTVLNAALDNGIDAPYACMVGACTTCKAKLVKGQIEMDDQTALLPKEVEEGYILTCQSHPKSSYIEVDYDA